MTIGEVLAELEQLAPPMLQESYDNAGLIVGQRETQATGAILCLDSTEAVIDEAINKKCNLVIAHHPIVFGGLKRFNGSSYVERVVMKAIKHDIAIYAAHTNLDNVPLGVNKRICDTIGLQHTRILAPKRELLKKLFVFCPTANATEVRQAMFAAGAGHIGNYDECSFNSEGTGTFRGGEGTNPFVGQQGDQHHEAELKIEVIVPAWAERAVVRAMVAAHPYEEVAYDLVPLGNALQTVGAGMVGELPEKMSELDFLNHLKAAMQTDCVRYTPLRNKPVKTVAVCGGAGSFLLSKAIAAQADVFVTGDFKYHQFFDAEGKLVIADIGHFESEQFTMHLFRDLLTKKFPTFALHLTNVNTNPVNYL